MIYFTLVHICRLSCVNAKLTMRTQTQLYHIVTYSLSKIVYQKVHYKLALHNAITFFYQHRHIFIDYQVIKIALHIQWQQKTLMDFFLLFIYIYSFLHKHNQLNHSLHSTVGRERQDTLNKWKLSYSHAAGNCLSSYSTQPNK